MMNAPEIHYPLNVLADEAKPGEARIREIPYNYTSFSDREVVIRLLGARAWDLPRGCAAAYYPEASGLVSASTTSSGTHTPLYKEVPVRIRAARTPA